MPYYAFCVLTTDYINHSTIACVKTDKTDNIDDAKEKLKQSDYSIRVLDDINWCFDEANNDIIWKIGNEDMIPQQSESFNYVHKMMLFYQKLLSQYDQDNVKRLICDILIDKFTFELTQRQVEKIWFFVDKKLLQLRNKNYFYDEDDDNIENFEKCVVIGVSYCIYSYIYY